MIIGIDLGTTNSLAAAYTEDGPKIIPNRLGEVLTPSVVSIDDEKDEIYVGKTAYERLQLYPETSAAVFKRSMGSDKKFRLGKREFTAEELSSFVLRSLKEDAEEYLGESVTEAVISVPAYFNDMRRKATKRAGELAGLKVDRIISEPTAAAIAYGLYNDTKPAKNLVFDLGGGTFDVSILDYFPPILEVRAVAGDNFLGGEDFTEVIENLFYSRNDIKKDSLSYREQRMVYKAAESCKKGFSEGPVSVMHCHIGDMDIDMELTQRDYDKACEDLYERIRIPVKRALTDAKLRLSDIDKIVMVGGSTRLPGVRSFVSKLFKTFPDTNINPDEAVALGAALQGAMKERRESIREVVLTDVCPFTLGTEISVEMGENRREAGHFFPIIERNTIIPASRTERFFTIHDNQTRLSVEVLQGESRLAKNNLLLGTLEVEVPPAPAGAESVDITYTYDINSILEVEVTTVSTGEKLRKIIKGQYTEMTDEEIEERFRELSYLKIHPRDQEVNKLVLLRGERLYEESLGIDREIVEEHIRKFEQALLTQDKKFIDRERETLMEFLDAWEKGEY